MNLKKKKILYSSLGILLFLHLISSTLIELNVTPKPLLFDFAFSTSTNLIFLISLLLAIIVELIKLYYLLFKSFYTILNIKNIYSTHKIIMHLSKFTLVIMPILLLNYSDFLKLKFNDNDSQVLSSISALIIVFITFAVILLLLMLTMNVFRKKIKSLKIEDNISNFLIPNNFENTFLSIDLFSIEFNQERLEQQIYIFMVNKNQEIICLISNIKTNYLNILKKGLWPPRRFNFK